MMNKLSFTSTLSRSREHFIPQQVQNVCMYVCGVTPYDDAHIGHGRCYVTFDVVYRLLRSQGYEVTYIRNITDIDDKLLNRAHEQYGDASRYHEIATHYTQRFQEDVARLGCLPPSVEPRVTDHIAEIIVAVEKLIFSGHAYVANGSVYYRVASYQSYGELSHQKIDDLLAGARIERNDEKENQLDFALWKSEQEGSFWQAPWGWGRPGWHIECSVLAHSYGGVHLDLHGGGMDLMFPHHENERAQSEALYGAPFVKIWMHNAFVRVKQEKMSKSLGNFVTLRQAFERCEPEVLRYYYLIHHYRSPLDFSWDDIASARKSYQRLITLCGSPVDNSSHEVVQLDGLIDSLAPIEREFMHRMLAYLYDDLNVQGMFGFIFEHADTIRAYPMVQKMVKILLQSILGLSLQPLVEQTVAITPEIQKLIDERIEARKERNWKRSDELRAQLEAHGVVVHDGKV